MILVVHIRDSELSLNSSLENNKLEKVLYFHLLTKTVLDIWIWEEYSPETRQTIYIFIYNKKNEQKKFKFSTISKPTNKILKWNRYIPIFIIYVFGVGEKTFFRKPSKEKPKIPAFFLCSRSASYKVMSFWNSY